MYKVFFNRDCMEYGICDDEGKQILVARHKKQQPDKCFCYTRYKGVAIRTLSRLNKGQYIVFSYGNLTDY